MRIFSKNNPAKFHPDLIQASLKTVAPCKKKNNSNMGSVPGLSYVLCSHADQSYDQLTYFFLYYVVPVFFCSE